MSVAKATDIIPNLYEDDDAINHEDIVDDLTYDVYNLTACNYHPLRILTDKQKERVLLDSSRRSCQLLIKRFL